MSSRKENLGYIKNNNVLISRQKMFKNFKLEVPHQDLKSQLKFFSSDSSKKNKWKPKTIEVSFNYSYHYYFFNL